MLSIRNALEARNYPLSMGPAIEHFAFLDTLFLGEQPRRILQDISRRVGIGSDFYPTPHTKSPQNLTDQDLPGHEILAVEYRPRILTGRALGTFAEFLDKAVDSLGSLSSVIEPILNTVFVEKQSFSLSRSNRIKKSNSLDIATIPLGTAICDYHVIKRALFSASTG
jgi:hypothetical protein